MLKNILLGSAMLIASPAIAQDAGMTAQTAPAATQMPDAMQSAPMDTATSWADAAATTADRKMTSKERKAAAKTAAATPASDAAVPQSAATTPATQRAPATPAAQADTAQAPMTPGDPAVASATPAQPAAAQPASGDQVATIVESEFGTYDKDANGTLDKIEFASWMDALKAKAPNATAKPADPKWNDVAFAQADSDKSTSVTKQELTGFLGGAAKAG